MATTVASPHSALADEVAQFYADPLGFVRFAYPWGEPGDLEHETGPDEHQEEFLRALGGEVLARRFDGETPVMPIRMAETSGHGTGKSAMGAWITDWILSTRPNSRGTVTAGTATQLEERTWAAIEYWTKLCITHDWFDVQARGIYAKSAPASWNVIAQTCKEENAQSFAGQHAKRSTSWYLFDEASTVPDKIWKVAFGGLTDGEAMFFAWGQPERNTGQFHSITFGRERDRWNHRNVDSRNSRFTNKALMEEWIQDYGIDSDFCRVRIMGLAPRADELQYIDKARVEEAAARGLINLSSDPLIAGCDVSGGGKAWSVCRFRRGLNARDVPSPIRIPGDNGREREVLITRLATVLADQDPVRKVAALFIDSAFGAPVFERLRSLNFTNVFEVNFGGDSADPHCKNWRAYMYKEMKDWLARGCIDPLDEKLAIDLVGPGYHINRSGQLVIESKQDMQKRGVRSPDDGDALALTFARPVAVPRPSSPKPAPPLTVWS